MTPPRLQPIAGWRRAWRLASVQAAAALALLGLLQAEVLPLLQFAIPPRAWPWVSAGFGIAIVLLRLVAQPGALAPGEPSPPPKGPSP